jgi:hypothetical protein
MDLIMNTMNQDIKKAIKDLNKAKNDIEIFKILSKYNNIFELFLDNDYTGIAFTDNINEILSSDEYEIYMDSIKVTIDNDIGNRAGVFTLLELLNIQANLC